MHNPTLFTARHTLAQRRRPALLCAILAAGCATDVQDAGVAADGGTDFVERVVEAVEELRVGLDDGDSRYVFGSIHGIAIDSGGRVYVADGRNRSIRVYDEHGRHVSEFGRVGDGPGEFYNPCCVSFDRHGRLWVYSDGDLHRQIRYDVFDLSGERPRHVLRVPAAEIGALRPTRRVLFDAAGAIVHPAYVQEMSDDYEPARMTTYPSGEVVRTPGRGEIRQRLVRLVIDSAGAELRRVLLPWIDSDSLGRQSVTVNVPLPGGGTEPRTTTVAVPATATRLTAHSPHGYADAINARYLVHWYDDDGELLHVLRRDVEGPLRTAEERAEAEASLTRTRQNLRERGGSLPPTEVPARHHPLQSLFFDVEGRLWVQRRTAADDAHEHADVWLPDGTYLHTVRWPRGVRLHHGVTRGDVIYGVALDEYDVPRLVRLRLPGG